MASFRKYKVRCSCPEDCIHPEFGLHTAAVAYILRYFPYHIRIDDDTWECPDSTTQVYISRV